MTDTQKATKSTSTRKSKLTAVELDAMKETIQERKREAGRGPRAGREAGEADVLAKIAQMPESDRIMAERIHEIVTSTAPALSPKTWYGMPAYANKDGKVVCFFTAADKFKSRYASFGFEESANLDDGPMWPTAFALVELTPEAEATIAALVRRAAS